MSERLETTKFDENVYFVRETARKKMGVDFIQQLFLHKNECIAEVDGDILAYLAIYQKLHPKAEIYIAVPEKGNPNKTRPALREGRWAPAAGLRRWRQLPGAVCLRFLVWCHVQWGRQQL